MTHLEQHDILPLGIARPAHPLPSWVTSLREQQVVAVREIVEAFNDGADVVFLDAPVGTGKTLIGELVRLELGIDRGLYVCSDKNLQQQFLADFPYARVMMGRNNYRPIKAIGEVTCEDCTSKGPASPCNWCPDTAICPYKLAQNAALEADVAVLNTSYMLHATNYTNKFAGFDLVVADECDMLENALIGFIEYEVPNWIEKILHLDYPKKASRKPTLIRWLRDAADAGFAYLGDYGDGMELKQHRRLKAWVDETRVVAEHLQRDVDNARKHEDDDSDNDESGRWIRDYETRTLKLRPVTVDRYGNKHLWRHGQKWLLMSGTVISSDEMADSLGLGLEYRTVTIPSSFPKENRPVILAPVANMTRAGGEDEWAKAAYAIEQIAAMHKGRILVHTVSYQLTRFFMDNCITPGHPKFAYENAAGKRLALQKYLATENAIIFAPSMDRGVDLKGDKCAVQVIAKCPFPSLGDKQVSSRLRLPGGEAWYAVKTVRDIVQMCGRGVRSETDSCVTYVLDQQFTKNVWGRHKHLFPAYFKEAINAKADVRKFIHPLVKAFA